MYQELVNKLRDKNKTISTMESCTGGKIVDSITNIENSSYVIKFSAVTYSNKFKIKMGVDKNIIDKYSVYSIETADEMSKNIAIYTDSNYGVGITGKLKKSDDSNNYGDDDKVFISIYDKDNDKFYHKDVIVDKETRIENKSDVASIVCNLLLEII